MRYARLCHDGEAARIRPGHVRRGAPMPDTQPPASALRRRLVGVGVGPGESGLITVKAIRALDAADIILVPATEASADGPGRAERIVVDNCPGAVGRIQRIPFSMADRSGRTSRRVAAWHTSADAAVTAFESGARVVCFATIGDPSVYSTFSYLAEHVTEAMPAVDVEVIPGITAMQALAAASRIPLVEGSEVLALIPATSGLETLDRALEFADTVVASK